MRKFKVGAFPDGAVFDVIDSPVGQLTIVASHAGLHAILWDCDCAQPKYISLLKTLVRKPKDPIISATKQQLTEYFQGTRSSFDLPLVPQGTSFQMQVWQELQKIPYGETISYGLQATRIGDKNKARAVGMANGQNPISIVIPCHRVIGSNGHLTGFGGGLPRKEWLLLQELNPITLTR